jgi:biopolymer transport protein ExbB/TolQ
VDRYPALYWISLVLAIIVSTCSLTYWIYKFSQWWKRRHRRMTRWQRSRQQQQERLAAVREEQQDLEALAADLSAELASTSPLWRPIHRRHLAGRLRHIEGRQADLSREAAQLEGQLAELELVAARDARSATAPRRSL